MLRVFIFLLPFCEATASLFLPADFFALFEAVPPPPVEWERRM